MLLFDSSCSMARRAIFSTQSKALQFHYMPVGTAKVKQEERLAVFGSEGKQRLC